MVTKEIREYMLENLKGHLEDGGMHPIVIETTISKCDSLEDKDLVSVWDETLSNDQKTWLLDAFDIELSDLGL